MSIIEGSRQPLDNTVDSESSESELDEDISQHEKPSEIEQIFRDASQIINSLYRLSMSVRNSLWNNRYIKSAKINTSYFEPYDIFHVSQKFPEAQKFNIDRLGKATSRRRQYLKFREEHAAKLAYFKDEHESAIAPSETTASGYGPQILTDIVVTKNEDAPSETSYATSLGRPTSTRMPRMPKEAANEQPFECPFCHTVAIVKDTHGWRKHVYRDLQPYVCTFKDCITPDETYESRRQWFNHELQKHRRVWVCSDHCQQAFPSSAQLITHLKKLSLINVADAQLPALIEMRASPIPRNAESSCPLCNLRVVGIDSLQKHLGRHLEELALFALPNDAAEPDDDTETSASDYENQDAIPNIQGKSQTEGIEVASTASQEQDAMDPQVKNLGQNSTSPILDNTSEDEEESADLKDLIAKQKAEQLLVAPPLDDISDGDKASSLPDWLSAEEKEGQLRTPLYPDEISKTERSFTPLEKLNVENRDKQLHMEEGAKENQKGNTTRRRSGEEKSTWAPISASDHTVSSLESDDTANLHSLYTSLPQIDEEDLSDEEIGEENIPGESLFHIYSDESHLQKMIDKKTTNAHKRLAVACMRCRRRKTRCKPGESKCIQCERVGTDCSFQTV